MLTWIDDRWHLNGRPIHAGDCMELRGGGGKWIPVRIESSNRGRVLHAVVRVEGREFYSTIQPEFDKLRWC